MLAFLITIIVVLLTMAQFYLKNKTMTSFATMIAAIFGFALAFSYYEPAAGYLISKGYGGNWAYAGILVVLFIVCFAVFRVLADLVWNPEVEFHPITTKASAIVCGLFTGLFISGVVLVALGMTPTGAKWPYARFGDGTASISGAQSAKGPLLAADGLVAGLFSWMSKGSLSSGKSFAVYRADYLDQIHLNGYKAKEGVSRIAGKDAVTVPGKGLRQLDASNEDLLVLRMEIKRGDVKDGGASNSGNEVSFTPGQVRLICKKQGSANTRGTGTAVYPQSRLLPRRSAPREGGTALTGVMAGQVAVPLTLDQVITIPKEDFKSGQRARLDLAFRIPQGMTPVLLQFKDNVVVSVPAAEPASEETEVALREGSSPPAENGRQQRQDWPRDPNS